MQRKLIKQGDNALTVTVPRKWTKNLNLKAGDEVNISEEEGNLLITQTTREVGKKISVDISGYTAITIAVILQSIYRRGFTEATLTFKNEKAPNVKHSFRGRREKQIPINEIITELVNEMIGFEIFEQNETSIVLKQISKPNEKDFELALRRIFLLEIDLNSYFYTRLKEKKFKFETVKNKAANIHKFINYATRLIEMNVVKKNPQNIFSSLRSFENAVNTYSYLGLICENEKLLPETIEMFKATNKLLELSQKLYFNFSFDKFNEYTAQLENYYDRYDKINPKESKPEVRIRQLLAKCASYSRYILNDATAIFLSN